MPNIRVGITGYQREVGFCHFEVWRHTADIPNPNSPPSRVTRSAKLVGEWVKSSSWDDSSAVGGVTYWYWARAIDRHGNESPFFAFGPILTPPANIKMSSDRLLGRDTDGKGFVEEIELVAPLAFTGLKSVEIQAQGITFADHVQHIQTARLLGRTTASEGAVEELTAGHGIVLSGGSVSVDGLDVAHGGTGASSLPATRVLLGNGTSPITTNSGLTYNGTVLWTQGSYTGGFGARSTAGVTDWNDASNVVSGNGPTLLLGSATNGPGPAVYFHVLNFEYISRDGTGTITQIAVPYGVTASINSGLYYRGRYTGTWSSWRRLVEAGSPGAIGGTTPAAGTFTDLRATGTVRFGTHAAIGAETVTGFITITDDAGVARKLAVVS